MFSVLQFPLVISMCLWPHIQSFFDVTIVLVWRLKENKVNH